MTAAKATRTGFVHHVAQELAIRLPRSTILTSVPSRGRFENGQAIVTMAQATWTPDERRAFGCFAAWVMHVVHWIERQTRSLDTTTPKTIRLWKVAWRNGDIDVCWTMMSE